MKIIVPIVILLLIIAVVLVRWRNQTRNSVTAADGSGQASQPAPNDVYMGLRNQTLEGSRAKFGLVATSKPTEPWGVLMDWGVSDGSATVVTLSDGNASVYLSSGGAYLGGIGQEAIRKAAQKTVQVADEFQPKMHATTTYPLPQRGEVSFYLLTDAGVFTTSASEKDLAAHRIPLAKLGDAAQDVITQYRLFQEGKSKLK
jgi:hypothetical protein